MCVFETADRTELIRDISQVLPHLTGDEMGELAAQVLKKLECILISLRIWFFHEVSLWFACHSV